MINNRMKEKYKQLKKDCEITLHKFSSGYFAIFSNAVETEQTKANQGEKKSSYFFQVKLAKFDW